jgi:hypothetical protein
MDTSEQEKKDISKVFAFLRAQLQAKEKELLELRRTDPSLLAPDFDQIDTLADTIASLQLSTQEGSFIFASNSVCDDVSPRTSVCLIDFNSIKNLPPTIWLSQSNSVEQEKERKPSIFAHLLSLPIRAYLASSYPSVRTKDKNQSLNRIHMTSHLLFMPLDTFKPSYYNISVSAKIKYNNNIQNNVLSTARKTTSLLSNEIIFSKEHWIKKDPSSSLVD